MTNLYNIGVILFVSFGSLTVGYSSSAVAGIIGLPGFINYFDVDTTGPNAAYANSMQGAINGIFGAGGVFGCFLVSWMADKYGRKKAIQAICLVALVATALSTAAIHIAMLLVGRFLQGIAAGALNTLCPIYQAEVSSAGNRGRMVGSHAVMLVGGISLANWVALGCYFITNDQLQWRLCLAIQAVPALCLIGGSFFLTESPRWLMLTGNEEAAWDSLVKLHGDPTVVSSQSEANSVAAEELLTIQKQIEIDRQYETSYFSLFTRPSTRKRLLIGIFMMFINQSTGQNVLYAYQVNLLAGLNVSGWLAILVLSVYTAYASFMNWVNGFLLDRFGRVRVLVTSMVCVVVSISVYTALVATYSGTSSKSGNIAGICFLFVFITFFGGGIDATGYVYAAELFPTYMRAQGVASSVATYFGMSTVYTALTPTAIASVGWKWYLVFIILTAFNTVIVVMFFPETNGLTLEETGRLFGEEVVTQLDLHSQDTNGLVEKDSKREEVATVAVRDV